MVTDHWSETNNLTNISDGSHSHSLSDDPVRIWNPQTAKLFRLCHLRIVAWRWQSQFAVLCLPGQFLRLTRRSLSNGFPLSSQACARPCPLLKVQILFLKGAPRSNRGKPILVGTSSSQLRLDLCSELCCQPSSLKSVSQNVFLKMYFSKCISQNEFLKMYFLLSQTYPTEMAKTSFSQNILFR